MRKSTMLAMLFGVTVASGVNAQDTADAEAGQLLAEQYCARCHDISPTGANKEYPPSFAAIAVFRGRDQIWQRIMFPAVHTSMPAMWEFLQPDNVNLVLAYIESLEKTE